MSKQESRSLVTVVLISLNHELFVREAITSIHTAFDGRVPVVHIDSGSKDQTLNLAQQTLDDLSMRVDSVAGKFTTMQALNVADALVSTPWACLLSADDSFSTSFGETIQQNLIDAPLNLALNSDLTVIDASGRQVGQSHSKWTRSDFLNRRLMSLTNPGRAPGCVIPWRWLRSRDFFERHLKSSVEDYLLWAEVARFGCIRRDMNLRVNYRLHGANSGSRFKDPKFAWSLGYAGGYARQTIVSFMDLPAHRRLMNKWRMSVDSGVRENFDEGYESGRSPESSS